eukprot:11388233-Karenia_brevis.AAC.2
MAEGSNDKDDDEHENAPRRDIKFTSDMDTVNASMNQRRKMREDDTNVIQQVEEATSRALNIIVKNIVPNAPVNVFIKSHIMYVDRETQNGEKSMETHDLSRRRPQ